MSPRRKGTAAWIREEHARERAARAAAQNEQTAHAAPTCTFEPEAHVYTIGGIVVPSVTQVLVEERFLDFRGIPDRTLEAARDRGRYVHEVLHAWLEDDFELDDCEPTFRGYVDSAIRYLEGLGKRPYLLEAGRPTVEYRFWHTRRMFAGTMDYLGWDRDGVLSIDDWKTSEPTDVASAVQTAAYEIGVRECLLPTIYPPYDGQIRRRSVKLHKDGKPATPQPHDDPRDLAVFLAALSCVHYRRNGLKHAE